MFVDLYVTAWASYPKETGGVLLGHHAHNDPLSASVQHLVGPGPGARHEARGFAPDHEWQAERVAELWRDDRNLEYLGDWHTHPGGSPGLSPLDKDALRVITRSVDAQQDRPVMLVLALHPDRSSIGATALDGEQFKAVRVAAVNEPIP